MTSTRSPSHISRRALIRAGATIMLGMAMPRRAAGASAFRSRRITVRVRGNGPDVVLIPGLASGPEVWRALIAALPGYRFHLVHVRGFAGLPADLNASGPLLAPVAGEIGRYIAVAGLARPTLIGHSMGGSLALLAGSAKGVRPARVIVVDMLPEGAAMLGGTSAGLGFLAGQLNSYLTGTLAGRQLLADMVRRTPGGADSDPAVIAGALADVARQDLTPLLAALPCPLGVIYALPGKGALDRAQHARYRAAYAPARNARLVGLGPGGHMIMLDRPGQFAGQIREFLKN